MPSYQAPLDDIRFILNEVLDMRRLSGVSGLNSFDTETSNAILASAAEFSQNVLAPLNAVGDRQGCIHDRHEKTVKTPDGFQAAYAQFCANGLTTISCDPNYGGMGLPLALNTAIGEMLCAANMSFAMYPGLSHGAYNALATYGTQAQKDAYLAKLVSGEWTGTMCLTEPQCGTDLALIKTVAKPAADGSYALTGTKIFISAGEHDLAPNIIHLVLARIDDPATPPGIKGISLFCVPKWIEDKRNGVYCRRIEEKMGIHGNSTCELGFEGARGWLVGDAHKGMRAMFVMMNEARLGVGLQGLGLSEVAYQNAVAYAQERVQSPPIEQKRDAQGKLSAGSVTIIHHPDVRRDLLTIKSQAEGGRMLAYWLAYQLDMAHHHPDKKIQSEAQNIVDLLTPVVKAHLTDNAEAHTSAAIQCFGGHGYIREHGIEQFYRDARITRLYEGTNGIQALDLIMRKILMSRENLVKSYFAVLKEDLKHARAAGVSRDLIKPVKSAMCRVAAVTWSLRIKGLMAEMMGKKGSFALNVAAGAQDYMKLLSLLSMGHMWIKMATTAHVRLKEGATPAEFYETKIHTARFYMAKIMPQIYSALRMLCSGSSSLMSVKSESFTRTQTTVAEKPWSATG